MIGTAGFAALYEAEAPKLRAYFRRHLNARHDLAEDLAADAFLRAWQHRHRWEDRGLPFHAWLWQIAHNRLIDHVRTQPPRQLQLGARAHDPRHGDGRVYRSDTWEEALAALAGAPGATDGGLDHVEAATAVAAALGALTPDQRRAVELRWLEDRSLADTARVMGKQEDAIKQLQVRAFARLRTLLA
jgi:RNA polymerase sigma-70 factor (ECF subfamily)